VLQHARVAGVVPRATHCPLLPPHRRMCTVEPSAEPAFQYHSIGKLCADLELVVISKERKPHAYQLHRIFDKCVDLVFLVVGVLAGCGWCAGALMLRLGRGVV